ncbi:SRSF protein kinase 3-like [Glossina fuscipes]|uniref:non-specific serine/threonine protein kinase n=1 Tax=Glossina fuscipes TaxID=7396 RepID=A0A9C5Z270_9MUSC|nr:SRSF protein kinase 3-like [Glossina fuscipes]
MMAWRFRKCLKNIDVLNSSEKPESITTNAAFSHALDTGLSGSEDEQESVNEYRRGGYHPVLIGDIFQNRFRVVRKVGWGNFSTVWLCRDLREEEYVVLKVVKSAPHYTEIAGDEIRLLETIRDSDPTDEKRERFVRLLNQFTARGVNGVHTCLVFEALGCSLYKLIVKNKYQGLAIDQVRNIIKQVLEGLDYLHRKCGIIHTDIKPENILLVIDNAIEMNQQIDNEVTNLRLKGSSLPDSYISSVEKQRVSLAIWPMQKSIENNSTSSGSFMVSRIPRSDGWETASPFPSSPSLLSGESIESGWESDVSGNVSKSPGGRIWGYLDEKNFAGKSVEEAKKDGQYQDNLDANDTTDATDNNLNNDDNVKDVKTVVFINSDKIQSSNPDESVNEIKKPTTNDQRGYQRPKKFMKKAQLAFRRSGSNTNASSAKEQTINSSTAPRFSYTDAMQSLVNNMDLKVKIADLGNACFESHHFTEAIQTRQYRSVEVLLGNGYSYSADIWSTACMAFEIATGDYLFDPHACKSYSKDEHHLALMIQMLGPVPPDLIYRGKHGLNYFSSYGSLRSKIKLKPRSMTDLLIEKYSWQPEEAKKFSEFLLPMLEYDPNARATAAECLKHPWME